MDGTKEPKDRWRWVGWAVMAVVVLVAWQSCVASDPDRCEQTARAGLDAHEEGDITSFDYYYEAAVRLGCL